LHSGSRRPWRGRKFDLLRAHGRTLGLGAARQGIEHNRRRRGDVDRIGHAPHRNFDDGVGEIDDLLGDAIEFAAENQAYWKPPAERYSTPIRLPRFGIRRPSRE
jgi:hypothetical protein